MTKAIAQTYRATHRYYANLVYACIGMSLFAILSYASLVYVLISRTVALEKTQSETTALSSSVNKLDAEYIKLTGAITPDMVRAFGMKPGQVSVYITKTASLGSVALSGHEL